MSLIVTTQRNYKGKFCTKCDTLCYTYEQGLACDCDKPWITEVIYDEDYPDHWEDCQIAVKYVAGNNARKRWDTYSPEQQAAEIERMYQEERNEKAFLYTLEKKDETDSDTHTTSVNGRSAT